jgi:hypothetical protein
MIRSTVIARECAALLRWADTAFDPHAFDPAAAHFDGSTQVWRAAFVDSEPHG